MHLDGTGGGEGLVKIRQRAGSGPARVAWKVGAALPVVQCVRLRTTGDPVGGYTVHITGVEEPTALDASMVSSWPWYRTLSPA